MQKSRREGGAEVGEQKRKPGRQSTWARSKQCWWSTQAILLIPHMMNHNNQCWIPFQNVCYMWLTLRPGGVMTYLTLKMTIFSWRTEEAQLIDWLPKRPGGVKTCLTLKLTIFSVGGKKKHYWVETSGGRKVRWDILCRFVSNNSSCFCLVLFYRTRVWSLATLVTCWLIN